MDDLKFFTPAEKIEALKRIKADQGKWDTELKDAPLSSKLYAIAGIFDGLIANTPESLVVILQALKYTTEFQDALRQAAMLLDTEGPVA